MQTETMQFLEKNCPHIWALLNHRARRVPPKGFVEFLSGKWTLQGQTHLRLADARVSRLIAKTSERLVGDAYRRDLSGVDSEQQLAELLCEISLADALGSISSVPPVLRPKTGTGTECDVKVVVEAHVLYGESKRLADSWEGGTRSIVKSSPDFRSHSAVRPRAMDLFSKLKDSHTQFPRSALGILFLFHPSVWNTPMYIKQVLFGDSSALDETAPPQLHDDGLFFLPDWQEIAACVHSGVNDDGSFSIVRIWKNPKANVPLPETVLQRLAVAG